MLYKCKTCGTELEISEGLTVVECAHCGTKQTVLKSNDDSASKLFAHADDSLSNSKKIALLNRGFMELEEGHYKKGKKFFDRSLDYDAEFAMAYVGKLMADLRVERQENLTNYYKSFENNKNFQKAMRFADEELKQTLQGYMNSSKERSTKLMPTKIFVIIISAVNIIMNVLNIILAISSESDSWGVLSHISSNYHGYYAIYRSTLGSSSDFFESLLLIAIISFVLCLFVCFISYKYSFNKKTRIMSQTLFSLLLLIPYIYHYFELEPLFLDYYSLYQLTALGWLSVVMLFLSIAFAIVQYFLIKKMKHGKKK